MLAHNNNTYNAAFFIVPSHVLNLPGMTLGFLKVYETIFQFWNHRQDCFLSNESLCERTQLGVSQIYEAFTFFEKHNLLSRKKINGRRYFIQPEKKIETDCGENKDPSAEADSSTNNIPNSAGAENDFRPSGSSTSGAAEHNNKNINKENNVYIAPTSNTFFEDYKKQELQALNQAVETKKEEEIETEALNDPENQAIFHQRFSEREVTIVEIMKAVQEHYHAKGLCVGSQRFKKWLRNERPENFPQKKRAQTATTAIFSPFTEEERELMYDYNHALKYGMNIEACFPNEERRKLAVNLLNRAKDMQCGNQIQIQQRRMPQAIATFLG